VYAGAGAVMLMDLLDYETSSSYELTVRASDVVTGSVADTVVHIAIEVRRLPTVLFGLILCQSVNDKNGSESYLNCRNCFDVKIELISLFGFYFSYR